MDQSENGNASILIVDDAPEILKLLNDMLSRRGYRVRAARNGEAALQAAAASPPDLILLDIRMPDPDGYEVCRRLKADERFRAIPVIFISALTDAAEKIRALNAGGADYVTKPFQDEEILARVKIHLDLKRYRERLEEMVSERTAELEKRNLELEKTRRDLLRTNLALQESMKNLHIIRVADGVFWLQVPEAELYILCGCPADVVKLMMKRGLISVMKKGKTFCETGPNAILLSDILIQNGNFSNLAEFPVLQMLYRQGMLLPDHPNNTGRKPILIGIEEQVNAQMEYVYRGNYGLHTIAEITQTGISEAAAADMMRLKLAFAFGKIHPTENFLEKRIAGGAPAEIRNGVFVRRKALNHYEFTYKGASVEIDLNLDYRVSYASPYPLTFHNIEREYFSIVHTGEGDGWDMNRPCMASILVYLGKIYLIDAGPNIRQTLTALSIDIGEIEGIFHTHAHDDHFAGLPTLMRTDHRLKYYATPLVRASVAKKLSALMSMDERKFSEYFDVKDLEFDVWTNIGGLEVKPIFSPHPVETNILYFRTLGDNGYKTYAHWADISSFKVLENMIADDGADSGISRAFYDQTRADYLIPADIKKIDIGGGLIHGEAADFQDDASGEIILAHTALSLDERQKEIGSERSFGTVDTLIPANQNYLLKHAEKLLKVYFALDGKELHLLMNAPMVTFNPGAIIEKKGAMISNVYLILSGIAEFICSESGIQNRLSNGCFIGDLDLLKNTPSSGTWRAVSYVRTMVFSAGLFHTFLERHELFEQVKNTLDKIEFLQSTFLFGEGISYPVQNKIARNMILKSCAENEKIAGDAAPWLCMLKSGQLQLMNRQEEVIETLTGCGYCGEENIFSKAGSQFTINAGTPSEVYLIQKYPLTEIPIVHWKLLETYVKRIKHLYH